MRSRFPIVVSAGLLLINLSCGSEDSSVQAPNPPGPLFTEYSAVLVPNGDVSPQEWGVYPSMTNKYEAIDETYPLDDQFIHTGYNLTSRFAFSNISGNIVVTALELRMHVTFSLHQNDGVYLAARYYIDGAYQDAYEFRWCTANPPIGCDFIGEPDGSTTWTINFTGLSLNLSQLNSLLVEVQPWFIYSHGPELLHSIHIDNMYVTATYHNAGGNGGKEPDPNQP